MKKLWGGTLIVILKSKFRSALAKFKEKRQQDQKSHLTVSDDLGIDKVTGVKKEIYDRSLDRFELKESKRIKGGDTFANWFLSKF